MELPLLAVVALEAEGPRGVRRARRHAALGSHVDDARYPVVIITWVHHLRTLYPDTLAAAEESVSGREFGSRESSGEGTGRDNEPK